MRLEERQIRERSQNASTPFAKHDARFSSATVHFTTTLQMAGKVDIVRASRRLLNADLALAAAWPSETAIRVPKRFQRLARPLRRAHSMNWEYQRAVSSGTWRAATRLAFKHPKIGVMHFRALWAPRTASDLEGLMATMKVRSLMIFLLKHPIVGVRNVLPNIRFVRSSKKGNHPEPTESVPPPEGQLESAPMDSELDDERQTLALLEEVERMVLDQQLVAAAEREIDSRLFGGKNHDEDRFVRLALRNSYHEFNVPGTTAQQTVVFEPRLLLHESGAIQLSIALRTEGPLNTSEVLELMYSPGPRIVRSEFAKPLLIGSGWENRVTGWADELDAGAPLAVIAHSEPVSIQDVLFAHADAVMRVMRQRCTSWVTFPLVIAVPGPCCEQHTWRKNHREDVVRIALRSMSTARVAEHVQDPTDFSLRADHSLFASMGSAAYFQWEGNPPVGVDELNTVLVVEYALLLYMRLQSMETEVARMALGERELRDRYKDAILLFSELRQGNLRAGESRIFVAHMLQEMGANHIRPTIESALNLAGMAHSTKSDAKAARRSWWITLVATVVAVVVAVPSVSQLLDAAKTAPTETGGEWLLTPLKQSAALGFWGPWVVLGSISGVLLFTWFAGWVLRRRPRGLPGRRRGFAWPTQITVQAQDTNQDASADQKP
jgi:hypothetical protein